MQKCLFFDAEQMMQEERGIVAPLGMQNSDEVLAGTDPLSQDAGAEHTIRYFYDDDDRLISANSGEGNASSGTLLSPSGNELRTTAIGMAY